MSVLEITRNWTKQALTLSSNWSSLNLLRFLSLHLIAARKTIIPVTFQQIWFGKKYGSGWTTAGKGSIACVQRKGFDDNTINNNECDTALGNGIYFNWRNPFTVVPNLTIYSKISVFIHFPLSFWKILHFPPVLYFGHEYYLVCLDTFHTFGLVYCFIIK